MKRLLVIVFVVCCGLSKSAGQGIPIIRNFMTEDYHANNNNFDVETDENGNIFVANFEGLLYYDHAQWRILRTPGTTRVTVSYRAEDNTIWVGGYNYFGKIVYKNNGELALKRIGGADLFRGEVKEIFERDGQLQFAVSNGIIYQVKGDSVFIKKQIDQNRFKIGMLDVINIEAMERGDKDIVMNDTLGEEAIADGLKAIIRKNAGLIMVDENNHTQYTITDQNGLCSNNIGYAIYDEKFQLWGATGKGVFSIQIPSAYSRFTQHEGITGSVLSIEKFDGRIYIGTDEGLLRLEGMQFVKVPGINYACWDLKKSAQGLLAATADGVYRIFPNGSTKQLTSTSSTALLDEGLQFYSGELSGVYLMQANGQGRKRVSILENVRKIVKDAEGTIWLQNLYGAVWYKSPSDNTFKLYKTGKKAETMATIVPTGGKVTVICAEDTKPFPYPLYSFADDKGVSWLTNNEGKGLYRWKDNKRNTDLDQLLAPIQDMTVRAMFIQNDEIWLGSDNGLTIINTRVKEPMLDIQPKLFIRSIVLNGDSILWGGFGTMPKMLEDLNYSESNLTFTFSMNYTSFIGNTQYRYRMDNGNWSAWSTSISASFTNVPDGNHTFSVQAQDAMNRQTDVVSIQFYINPPFYRQWYMYLLYALLLIAAIYAFIRLRLRRLERDKQRLETVIQERTAEVVKQKDEIEEKSKSLETALKDLGEAQHELIRQEKMATVGKLTQGLIDRILNPLNYINNFAKLSEGLVKDIEANIEDDKDQMDADNYEDTIDVLSMLQGNLQKVGEHGQNTTRTLKAMEEMLKDRSGGIVPMNLAAVIRQDGQMLQEYYKNEIAEYGIRVNLDCPEGELTINGNAEQLSKTVMSMLGNSVYALVKKAQRQKDFTPTLSLRVTPADDTVSVTIHDNGIGIEDTIIDKIFDPFFTTKTTGEASGVGLYLSREIIQNHGGDIQAKSVKDEYSEFTFTIPVIKA